MGAYEKHIKSYNDIVTPYEATRAGFVAIALEKNNKATPFVEEARALRAVASEAKNPEELLNMSQIFGALLASAGLSDKAASHLTDTDKLTAVQNLIEKFLKPAGVNFVEELVYRFLLTRGDTLGGMMRNITGVLGERKFARSIISMLSVQKTVFYWLHGKSKDWFANSSDNAGIENNLKGISWPNKYGNRVLLFNITVPNVGKNVDLCLLNCSHKDLGARCSNKRNIISVPGNYIALGELKGGIDPAGADEHWKTANTALERIRRAFSEDDLNPHTFFVGAAIENAMAQEIFDQLNRKILANAANLTNESQILSLCKWLTNI